MKIEEAKAEAYKNGTYGKVGITKLEVFNNGWDSGAKWQAEQDKTEAGLFAEWVYKNDWRFDDKVWVDEDMRTATTEQLFKLYTAATK